jgi:hypothetical protein
MLYKTKGVLKFSPEDITNKHINQSPWKRVAMIILDGELDRYYAWFINQFISDRVDMDKFNEIAEKYDNTEVELYYSIEPFTNGKHWWLRTFCLDIEPIREEMGLDKYPHFGIHLTLGHVSNTQLPHGEYIKEVCDAYGLLNNQPRKPFGEYIIIDNTI